ncbi:ABC transporter ATP-binding protein [Anthocerotibacter panamensis]|uniref:ABC transporter ATP-binding protein n=1 Tax=Anthocerotibacter panamensis TaxID=2857077 RepID=UPI001FD8E51B|nr:ABC transporter ATP-binding protein [Anthocerotibacter panamensis]
MAPLLEVSGLVKTFPTKGTPLLVLDHIDMVVRREEFVSIVGASGSGKSTLLNIIAGLVPASSGTVRLQGQTVTGPGPDLGMVFQSYTLYPWLTVAQNIGFGPRLEGQRKREIAERVAYYMDVVGLSKFAEALPKQLSGGMKQRVAIARALANEPQVLLMDEPFGALDAQTRSLLQEFMLQIWRETKKTILMITHDIEEAIFLSQRVYVLSSQPGRVKAELPVPLTGERTPDSKEDPQFQQLAHELRNLLRQEALHTLDH